MAQPLVKETPIVQARLRREYAIPKEWFLAQRKATMVRRF
jgi:hypothetical protein